MNHLIRAMLDKNVLSPETVVTANYSIRDSVGRLINRQDDFIITEVTKQGDEYRLKLKQIIGNAAIIIWAKDVVALDGMKPERYVDVYDINPDGSTKKVGKKRGRKPKSTLGIAAQAAIFLISFHKIHIYNSPKL